MAPKRHLPGPDEWEEASSRYPIKVGDWVKFKRWFSGDWRDCEGEVVEIEVREGGESWFGLHQLDYPRGPNLGFFWRRAVNCRKLQAPEGWVR